MKVHQQFATFVVDEDTLVVFVLLGMDPKRSQLLSQRRLGLKNQRSLTTKDPKIFGYLKLLDFLLQRSKKEKWFLDCGYSRHMIGYESKFAFFARRKRGYMTFGDNGKSRIIRHGSVGNNSSSLIENVLLVDGLKHNLWRPKTQGSSTTCQPVEVYGNQVSRYRSHMSRIPRLISAYLIQKYRK